MCQCVCVCWGICFTFRANEAVPQWHIYPAQKGGYPFLRVCVRVCHNCKLQSIPENCRKYVEYNTKNALFKYDLQQCVELLEYL